MKELFEALKARLRARQDAYVEHYDYVGDTESGFHSTDEFDIEKLMQEIDAFEAEFEAKRSTSAERKDQGEEMTEQIDYKDVTESREFGVIYTNTTAKHRMVQVVPLSFEDAATFEVNKNYNPRPPMPAQCFSVRPGETYQVNLIGTMLGGHVWQEKSLDEAPRGSPD